MTPVVAVVRCEWGLGAVRCEWGFGRRILSRGFDASRDAPCQGPTCRLRPPAQHRQGCGEGRAHGRKARRGGGGRARGREGGRGTGEGGEVEQFRQLENMFQDREANILTDEQFREGRQYVLNNFGGPLQGGAVTQPSNAVGSAVSNATDGAVGGSGAAVEGQPK